MAVQFLVHEKDGKGRLPYTGEDGKPDHRLMGAAWAALHEGYRGNKYEGPDKQKAIAKLERIYKEEGMGLPGEKSAGAHSSIKFISAPITKVYEGDDGAVYVDGCLAAEEVDDAGEVMDWASSVPNFRAWNRSFSQKTAGAEGGVSVGNLRVMHQRTVAGKFVRMEYDEDAKKVLVTAKVTVPAEQDNVRQGVYTAFSLGAKYLKKWWDASLKAMRWTAKPLEGSLVDYGSIPSTNGFVYRTLDGAEEARSFDGGRRALRKAFEAAGKTLTTAEEDRFVSHAQKGLYCVSSFAQLLEALICLRDAIEFEREQEGDDSPVTDRIAEITDELLECLASYTQEQVSEEITAKEKTMDLNNLAGQVDRRGKAAGMSKEDLKSKRDAAKQAFNNAEAEYKASMQTDDEEAEKQRKAKEAEEKEKAEKEKEEKSKAAGAGGDMALKRADIEQIIEAKLAPFGESLQVMGETLKLIASSPMPTSIRRTAVIVGKSADGGAADAEKSVDLLLKEGKTTDAIITLRQRPHFVTAGQQ